MKEFTISYSTGKIVINPCNYFAKASITNAKKLLKLASAFNNDSDRKTLIDLIKKAKDYWYQKHREYKTSKIAFKYDNSTVTLKIVPKTEIQWKSLWKKLNEIIVYLKQVRWSE